MNNVSGNTIIFWLLFGVLVIYVLYTVTSILYKYTTSVKRIRKDSSYLTSLLIRI